MFSVPIAFCGKKEFSCTVSRNIFLFSHFKLLPMLYSFTEHTFVLVLQGLPNNSSAFTLSSYFHNFIVFCDWDTFYLPIFSPNWTVPAFLVSPWLLHPLGNFRWPLYAPWLQWVLPEMWSPEELALRETGHPKVYTEAKWCPLPCSQHPCLCRPERRWRFSRCMLWADHLPVLSVVQLLSWFGWSWFHPSCGQGLEGSWARCPLPPCSGRKAAAGAALLSSGQDSSCPRSGTACLYHAPELLIGSENPTYVTRCTKCTSSNMSHSKFPGAHFITHNLKG